MGAVEEATGLKLNYYALVNMHGFSKLVDAVGGVTINVKERTAIGGIGSPIRGYIPAGTQKLNGDQTLWYARSRVQNDDWSRMGRQKCVMNAMLQAAQPAEGAAQRREDRRLGQGAADDQHPAAGPRRLHEPRAQGQDAEGVDRVAGAAADLHRQP